MRRLEQLLMFPNLEASRGGLASLVADLSYWKDVMNIDM